MVTILATGLLATLAMAKAPSLSLAIDRNQCLSESFADFGSDEVSLVAITHEATGNNFRNFTSPLFEEVDSGEARPIASKFESGVSDPQKRILEPQLRSTPRTQTSPTL